MSEVLSHRSPRVIGTPTTWLCALHGSVTQHISTLPYTSGNTHSWVSTCSGQAFCSRALFFAIDIHVIFRFFPHALATFKRDIVRKFVPASAKFEQCPMEFRVPRRKHEHMEHSRKKFYEMTMHQSQKRRHASR